MKKEKKIPYPVAGENGQSKRIKNTKYHFPRSEAPIEYYNNSNISYPVNAGFANIGMNFFYKVTPASARKAPGKMTSKAINKVISDDQQHRNTAFPEDKIPMKKIGYWNVDWDFEEYTG